MDESQPGERRLLENLQGNVLRGHGRDHAIHVFFSFRQPDRARATLRSLTERFVTSAYQQYCDVERYKAWRVPGGLFGNLFLTARGYERILPGVKIDALFPEPQELPEPHQIASCFATGMRPHAEADFADPSPETWDGAFREELHAMLLLADNDEHELMRTVRKVLAKLDGPCVVRGIEIGHVVRNDKGQGIEHFGFVDGRSQPLYLANDFKDKRTLDADGEPVARWDPLEPLSQVLIPDPSMKPADQCFGSFLVFRKLEQNVRGFRGGLATLASDLGLADEDAARAGAMVVGRFEDGTPLEMQNRPGLPAIANNFNYRTDPRGGRCPLHAHIRKVNPRGQSIRSGEPKNVERLHRITRRGIPYGEHVPVTQPLEKLPTGGVGVLFMCFQASIRRQFAFMQKEWCNSPWFPQAHVGPDPLTGQAANRPGTIYEWPSVDKAGATTSAGFEPFVKMKGGEFFFAPSLPFLTQLK